MVRKIVTNLLFLISALFAFFPNGEGSQQYVLYSIPKCGTTMLMRVFDLFQEYQIPHQQRRGACHLTTKDTKYRRLPHGPEIKKLIIIRDLRDACVSLVHYCDWIRFEPNMRESHPHFKWVHSNFDEKLDMVTHDQNPLWNDMFSDGIAMLNTFLEGPYETCLIHFEDLVGPKGGGSREKQIETLWRIAEFVNAQITEEEINRVADNLFGGSATFFKGQIGKWKENFKDYHKEAFKETYGGYLIQYGYEENNDW